VDEIDENLVNIGMYKITIMHRGKVIVFYAFFYFYGFFNVFENHS